MVVNNFNGNKNTYNIIIVVQDNGQKPQKPELQSYKQSRTDENKQVKHDRLPWYKFVWDIVQYFLSQIPFSPAIIALFEGHPK